MRKFEFKPWGWYLTLEENVDHKIKKIYVKPNHRFSLQYHNDREEHWVIVEGTGIITEGDVARPIGPVSYTHLTLPTKA